MDNRLTSPNDEKIVLKWWQKIVLKWWHLRTVICFDFPADNADLPGCEISFSKPSIFIEKASEITSRKFNHN